MNSDEKLNEINQEIDQMSLEELLYLRMSPQTYISKKFEKEIKDSKRSKPCMPLHRNKQGLLL